jgi:hypothetical protein
MLPDPKQIEYLTVHPEETLGMARRPKPAHLTLLFACVLMRDFATIVRIAVLAVHDTRHEFSLRRAIAGQFVGDYANG